MRWVEVCKIDDIPELGAKKLVGFGESDVALFRCSDGKVMAIDDLCPHKSGSLSDGMVTGKSVICGMHSKKIDLETGCIEPPDEGCVQTYPTQVKDETVFIGIAK